MNTTPICELPGYLTSDPGPDGLLDSLQALVPRLTVNMANLVCLEHHRGFFIKSTYRREHVFWRAMDPIIVTLNFDPYNTGWRVCWFLALHKPQP